jgi:hypothetical protein
MMMLEDDDPTPGPEPFEGDEPIQNVVSKLGKAGLNNETRRLVGQALTDETLAEADNYGSDEHRLEVPPAFSAHCRPLVSEAHVHFLRNGAFYESNDRRCDAHRLAGRNPPVRCIDCVHYRLAPLLDTERCDELDSWRNLKESIRRFSRLISETARAFMPPAVREAKLGSMKQERRGHESELNRLRDDHRGLLAETAVEEFQEALNDGGTLSRRPRALASCLAWGPGYALCMFFNPDGNCPRFEGFE